SCVAGVGRARAARGLPQFLGVSALGFHTSSHFILLYLSILFLHVYKRKNQLREAYSNNLWDGARKTLATL
ncbi:hypothetical protein M9458_003942, partial [Cirrhinus mrigala]